MIRICSWCNEHLGEKEPLEDKRITHGMCPKCFEKMIKDEYPVLLTPKEIRQTRWQ